MKYFSTFILLFIGYHSIAQGPFAPAAGEHGTKAIHKDSSIFVSWANDVSVKRGWQDITDSILGKVDAGSLNDALGRPDRYTISLGDGGELIAEFPVTITNRLGPDFAVFENAFEFGQGNYFLELAHVEVSSDGINYSRFPSICLIDTSLQVTNADGVDPTYVYNLAGKYVSYYGTPFDLQELDSIPNLNIDSITHIKLVDVVGCLKCPNYSSDSKGNIINDPFPTPFSIGGFDLDAIGIINANEIMPSVSENKEVESIEYRINQNEITVFSKDIQKLQLFDLNGRIVTESKSQRILIDKSGFYILSIKEHNETHFEKVFIP